MVVIFLFFVVLLCVLYVYSQNKHNYWIKKGVKGPKPLPLVGNFWKVLTLKETESQLFKDVYEEYQNEKVVGLYRGFTPVLLLRDPELINLVLIKDFPIFQDRGGKGLPGGSKFNKSLVRLGGETWKMLRQKLTPLFTSKKLRDMIPIVEQCVENFINYVEYLVDNDINHEIKSLKSKYTLQVIGSCAFGIQLNTFTDKEDEFIIMAKKIFNPSSFLTIVKMMEMIIPGLKKLDLATDSYNFFLDLVSKVIKQREKEPMKRKDFMDLMIELREQGKLSRNDEYGVSEIKMDDEMITAQAFVFYAAGYETTSAAMSFMIHELAINQDVQDKVYEEICRVTAKYHGKINYEAIKEMSYLEMVFDETLRKHSVAPLVFRKSLADYILPGVNVCIPKDTPVFISVNGMHMDKKYYDKPDIFNPENFSKENKIKCIPNTYIPFGNGPRNCIGKRFAIIEAFMGMAALLRKFKIVPSAKTKTTLEYKSTGVFLESKDGIWVKILKRN